MKHILVLGAGRSASSLLRYLVQQAEREDWQIKVVDRDVTLALSKLNNCPRAQVPDVDALKAEERRPLIEWADIVISMLPARHHVAIARDCVQLHTHLVTPSYISEEMGALDEPAKQAGVLLLNEMGADPGIDHMSAKKIVDQAQEQGGHIYSFESFTGGLVAPESDDNPWNYKFTWNPRNVVLAGQGGVAKYREGGSYRYVAYHQLFKRTQVLHLGEYGDFEAYPNRNSLPYLSLYGLKDSSTIYRGTLRRVGFSKAWDILIQLGATDDSYTLEESKQMSRRTFVDALLPHASDSASLESRFMAYFGLDETDPAWQKLVWLGLFENKFTAFQSDVTPAIFLQSILEEKWALHPEDKDMLVFYHRIRYRLEDGSTKTVHSQMRAIGEDAKYTAMSNTVGLPCAIGAEMILNNTLTLRGVHLPVQKEIYRSVLAALENHGIRFAERVVDTH